MLYIPTVSISTKYAVACKSCRNGYYITEQQKDDLLNDRSEAEITSEGAILHKKGKPEVIDVQEPEERSAPEPARRRFCGRCGGRLDEQTGLCPVCDGAESTAEVQKKEFGRENVGQSFAESPAGRSARPAAFFFPQTKQSARCVEAVLRSGSKRVEGRDMGIAEIVGNSLQIQIGSVGIAVLCSLLRKSWKGAAAAAARSWSRGRSSARNADTGCRDMTRLDWEKMNWKKPD